jgi:hypothetical protein
VDSHQRAMELADQLSASPLKGGEPIYEWLQYMISHTIADLP